MLTFIDEVPYTVSQAFASGMKFSHRAFGDRIGHYRGVIIIKVFKQRFGLKHFKHLLGIIFPVCCAVNIAARLNTLYKFMDEGLRYQSAFMVAGLAPRIREINMNTVKAVGRNHILDDIDRVVAESLARQAEIPPAEESKNQQTE